MTSFAQSASAADRIISEMEKLIPEYLLQPEDRNIANGNMAICLIDEAGQIFGRVFGDYKIRGREAFKVAWIKASQVWITGMKTGEYEKAVYSGSVDERKYGIQRPDLIGWQGGQPITLKDGTRLSVGVSGIRGIHDLEIAIRAVAAAGL
jgi:uncharacterized protein GlcG (DUF336 family)